MGRPCIERTRSFETERNATTRIRSRHITRRPAKLSRALKNSQKKPAFESRILPPSPNDEIIKLMGRSRIAIGIGLTDGSPVSLLEAMIMGAFPIQADTVSTGEWIRDGENGFLVPAEEPASIAQAIQRAIDLTTNWSSELQA